MLAFARSFAGIAILLAALLVAVVDASALTPDQAAINRSRRMTNAERLARGLSPNKPQLRRSGEYCVVLAAAFL